MEWLQIIILCVVYTALIVIGALISNRIWRGKLITIECEDGYRVHYYSKKLPPYIPQQNNNHAHSTKYHRYTCDGIETVRDVIIAEDPEQAKLLFAVKYPTLKKDTIKIEQFYLFIKE